MPSLEMIIGLGGSLTAASLFFPQVFTSYRTKDTSGVPWSGVIIALLNGILWTSYGLLKNDPIIYVTNMVMSVGVFLLLLLKKKYG